MRRSKAFLLLILAALLLGACTFPSAENQAGPSQEAVATAVQMTLAAQPTQPAATNNIAAPAQPDGTSSPGQPTSTPFPSSTPVPSLTPADEIKETPTLTATAINSDPAVALGQPAMRDPLDKGSGFGIGSDGYEDDYTNIYMSDGALVLHSSSANGWHGWRLRPPKVEDFYLQATYQTQSCAGNDLYGIIFRSPDYESGHGYYYSVTCDGRFSLSKWDDNGTSQITNGSALPAYNSGTGQTNRIGVLARGKQLTLYVNGKSIAEVEDSSLTSAGYFGPFLSGQSGNLTVALDEIAYWSVP